MNLAELGQKSPFEEEVYQALRRSLQRRKGFGLVFVRCSPATATRLIARVKSDISQKKIAVLSLTEPIDNLYNLVEARPDKDELNILIIQGLEKSLEPYIQPGYGGEGDYYTLSNLPPILGHLNQRRDGFRDRFPHLCFVFVLPLFAIKYLIQRAPDFFDWGGGVFEFSDSEERLVSHRDVDVIQVGQVGRDMDYRFQKRNRLWQILTTPIEQLDFGAPVRYLRKLRWFMQAQLLYEVERYKEAITSYDQALKYKPDNDAAWNNRGNALGKLQRHEEAIASYDQALKYKPDDDAAWYNRGIALGNLQRHEEAIASYDEALKYKPDRHTAWGSRGIALAALERYEEALASYNKVLEIKPDDSYGWYKKACCYGLQGQVELAVATLKQAIDLDPEHREMAKTDADFDGIREDDRFQALLNESVE
ncbi:tetratricopeptide repeat protein [Phormidesmis sp. 146-33]